MEIKLSKKRNGIVNGIRWIVEEEDKYVKLSLIYELPDIWFKIHYNTEKDIEETIESITSYPIIFRGIALFANKYTNRENLEANSISELFDIYSKTYLKYHLTIYNDFVKEKRELQRKINKFDNELQYELVPAITNIVGLEVVKVTRMNLPKRNTYNIYIFGRKGDYKVPKDVSQGLGPILYKAACGYGLDDYVAINIYEREYYPGNPEMDIYNHRQYLRWGVDTSKDVIESLKENEDYRVFNDNMVTLRRDFKKSLKIQQELFTSELLLKGDGDK